MLRSHGDMFDVDACTMLQWNISIEPAVTERRDEPAVVGHRAHGRVIERPQRIRRRRRVVIGAEIARFVRARDDHQRPVARRDVVEEHGDVHRARLGHVVVVDPGAVVLMPLPLLAFERGLGVDLELVHVDVAAEDLLHGLDQARVRGEPAVRFVVRLASERGARHAAALLAHDLLPFQLEDLVAVLAQHAHFVGREPVGKEEISVHVEGAELFGGQLHRRRLRFVSCVHPCRRRFCGRSARRPRQWTLAASARPGFKAPVGFLAGETLA